MERRNDLRVERLAERVVRHEEEALGRSVHKLSKIDERRYGCDFRSVDPDGTEHLIEIKGWGESLLDANGRFRYSTELRTAQWKASIAPGWRLEIVANITAAWEEGVPPERLTLTGADIDRRATPKLWEVPLSGFEEKIVLAARLAREGAGPDGSDWGSGLPNSLTSS
jgi:hypothetical protein